MKREDGDVSIETDRKDSVIQNDYTHIYTPSDQGNLGALRGIALLYRLHVNIIIINQ